MPLEYSTRGEEMLALHEREMADWKSILLRFDMAGTTEKMKYPAFSYLSR